MLGLQGGGGKTLTSQEQLKQQLKGTPPPQRIAVLDAGEKIAEGLPHEVAHDPRVVEVYLGTDAHATQVAGDADRPRDRGGPQADLGLDLGPPDALAGDPGAVDLPVDVLHDDLSAAQFGAEPRRVRPCPPRAEKPNIPPKTSPRSSKSIFTSPNPNP